MAKPKLTVKQAKLVKGIAQGKPKQVAALEAGYGSNLNSAGAIANDTLRIPSVQDALYAALERAGLTPDDIMNPVANALKAKVRLKSVVNGETIEIDAPDIEMNLKGHDRAMKIIQPRGEGGGTTVNNFGTIVAEMKDKYAD